MGHIDPAEVDGLILAGGKSSRFGSDKASYVFEGRRMVDRVASNMRPLVSDLMISLGSTPIDVENSKLVYDEIPGRGALSGIQAGFQHSKSEWILVCPVDMPKVDTAFFEKILGARRSATHATIAVDSDGSLHPLCGVFNRSLAPSLEKALGEQRFKVLDWIETLDFETVLGDASILENINYRPREKS